MRPTELLAVRLAFAHFRDVVALAFERKAHGAAVSLAGRSSSFLRAIPRLSWSDIQGIRALAEASDK